MAKKKKVSKKSAKKFLSVRLNDEQKELIEKAAESEGLQTSSFILMGLVRQSVLPESDVQKLKRRPVPFFNELHELMRIINNIGGNCKQLLMSMPDTAGIRATQASGQRASDVLTEAFQGKAIPATVDLDRFADEFRQIGTAFNLIVRSVNMGKPELSDLPHVLAAIRASADALTSAMTGQPVADGDMASVKDKPNEAREGMQATMQKAATAHTSKKEK